MKLTRIMRIEKSEIFEILKRGIFKFKRGTCWSGENTNNRFGCFEVAEHFKGIDVFVRYEDNKNQFERPSEDLKNSTAYDWKETDEWRNKHDLELRIDDINWILEQIKEDGFDSWLENKCDTGYIDLELI